MLRCYDGEYTPVGWFLAKTKTEAVLLNILGYKEQNCIVLFLTMQETKRVLHTVVAFNDCYDFKVVSKHLLVGSLLRK